jgi:hypothetical protein
MSIATFGSILDNKRYARVSAAHGGAAPPEARLPPGLVGSILIPAGMFWFAWTNGPEIHWIVPIIGSGLFGAGIVLVFLSLMTYLIDSCKSLPPSTFRPQEISGHHCILLLSPRANYAKMSSTPPRSWPPTQSSAPYSVQPSPFSRGTCTKT